MAAFYNIMLYGGLTLAIIFAVTAIVLFFVLKIPKAVGDITGSSARKKIEEIREKGYESVQGVGASKQEAIVKGKTKISVRDIKSGQSDHVAEKGRENYEKALAAIDSMKAENAGNVHVNEEKATAVFREDDGEEATDVLREDDGEEATDVLREDDGEEATDVLREDDGEEATDVLREDDGEEATDVLREDDGEEATDILREDDGEEATDILREDDGEEATDILREDDSEGATDVLREDDSESATDVLREDGGMTGLRGVVGSGAAVRSEKRLNAIMDVVVVHTEETI